jgi:hypothetical protein
MRAIARYAAIGGCLLSASQALAFEAAPNFDATKIPGIRAAGPNYSIVNPVRSDGFLRVYQVRSPYGDFTVNGDAFMQVRMIELAAVHELDKVNNSDAFNRALAEAGLRPIKFAGEMIVNPVQTIGNTFAGIGAMFGQIGAGMNNAGKSRDDAMGSLLGVTRQRRELAARLGVDPYTDFQPLAVKLARLSEAAAAGGLVVTGALMAIPGVAGIVVSNVSTSSDLTSIAKSYTADQLMDMTRQKLGAMGVSREFAEAFVMNRNYTPLDAYAVADALSTMEVRERPAFVARATAVNRRDAAFFMRRHVEMLAAFERKTGQVVAFTALGEFPFVQLKDGTVLGLWPVDALSWTEGTGKAMAAVNADLKRQGLTGRGELRISGQATAMARQNMKQMGWKLVENARP